MDHLAIEFSDIVYTLFRATLLRFGHTIHATPYRDLGPRNRVMELYKAQGSDHPHAAVGRRQYKTKTSANTNRRKRIQAMQSIERSMSTRGDKKVEVGTGEQLSD